MTAGKPISYYLAPVLLALSIALAAANWYLQPGKAMAWGAAFLTLGGMVVVFLFVSRRSTDEGAQRQAGDAIRSALAFAGLIMAFSLGAKLTTTLGGLDNEELSRRAMMVILGASFVFAGNAMPKTLTPLSALQCDPARVQAYQRFAGWTFVLIGLAFAIAWLVLPLDLAKPVSIALLMSGLLVIARKMIRLLRTRPREA